MEFIYYNPSDEHRSCVVRTMTKLTGKPYPEVKEALAALASEMGFAEWNEQAVFEKYLTAHHFHKLDSFSGMQVKALPLQTGTYCVFCTNRADFYHLLPVVDGVIYDRRDDSRELYVIAVYQQETNEVKA